MTLILLSSWLGGVVTPGIVFTIAVFIAFCIYLSYAIRDFRELISGLYYISVFIVIVNFFSLFFPIQSTAGENMYFIGGKNQFAMTIVPIIAIVYIYSLTIYKKIKMFPLAIILLGILSTYLAGSGTGIVISLMMAAFIFSPIKKFPSYNGYLLIYSSLFLSVVIFRLQETFLSKFIVGFLGKDVTFTNRTYIWDLAITKFKENWFLGSGRGNTVIIDWLPFLKVNEAHDGLLQIALDSGIIGVIMFIALIFITGKKIKLNKKHKFSRVLSFSIFAFLIIGIAESAYYRKEFWILLVLSYGLDKIAGQVKETDLDFTNTKTEISSEVVIKGLRASL
jgi:O-antigen ligase